MNPRLQAYLSQCIDHDEMTIDQGDRGDKAIIDDQALLKSPDMIPDVVSDMMTPDDFAQAKEWSDLVIENNRLRADLAAATAERDNAKDDLAEMQARAEKAEADYAKLCHAVVGANCHVDHAIETLEQQRKETRMLYDALVAIKYNQERDWLKVHPNVRTTFDVSSRRVAAVAVASVTGESVEDKS